MRKTYCLLLTLVVAATSLTSCSRSNYSFTNDAPAYLGSERVRVSTPVAEVAAEASAAPDATLPTSKVATRRPARAHRVAAVRLAPTTRVAATAPATAEQMPLTKLDHKTLKSELKRYLAAAPREVQADGKSQTTALILCILLGGIGVHQFYLGYTGRGILRIALALTSFLIIPAIVNLVLYIMDIIKIANGTLKPRDGEYGEKFK